jgi:hypothetical protein
MGSSRVVDHGLAESAAEPTAAIDLEAPLVEVAEKHGEPKCEQTAYQQQEANGEHQQASIGHIGHCCRSRRR